MQMMKRKIARCIENDNLADIKLKLSCTNSIAAMNIYMEQMKYHRGEDEEEFLQPYIECVESIRSTRAYNAMDGWMDSNSWREVINTSAR